LGKNSLAIPVSFSGLFCVLFSFLVWVIVMKRRTFLGLGVASTAAIAGGAAVWRSYAADMAAHHQRLSTGSTIFRSRFGDMEYSAAGEGPPVLMIHGTGGGFDQGLLFAARLSASGHKVIAPSRFGYLRTAFPVDPSPENQADAFVDLMDKLGMENAPVIGGSAGALSAIAFAIRYPDRCTALVAIVPAAYPPDGVPEAPNAVARGIIEFALKSDFLFWVGMKFSEDSMISALLATDPELVHAASTQEQARVRTILHEILPVSLRAEGFLNDARLTGVPSPLPLEKIAVPTLAISLEDDRFKTVSAARSIARRVKGAKLLIYPSGGHVWVGRDEEMFWEISRFIEVA
jgi:2-hydroxy-6-oxonona-2,4-dienedioate hydrolase